MAMHNEQLPQRIKVNIIETESEWGSKIDEVKFFDTLQEAEEFVKDFNSYNNKPVVPDWYMYAEIVRN